MITPQPTPTERIMSDFTLLQAPLGKKSAYITQYDPTLLFPIPRAANRAQINITNILPFHGIDTWTAYEVSWLNPQGKPIVAIADFIIPCESPRLVESKSFKLYLNSFNQTIFASAETVKKQISEDLSKATGSEVIVKLFPLDKYPIATLTNWPGICLDSLDITTNIYEVNPEFLNCEKNVTSETVYSHLLKSNCSVTGQPDWGSVLIRYEGRKINHEDLLKYIISFRNHQEFHEPCIERIYVDIMRQCHPDKLTVYGRYTRRGGLDINPFRSNFEQAPAFERLNRQ